MSLCLTAYIRPSSIYYTDNAFLKMIPQKHQQQITATTITAGVGYCHASVVVSPYFSSNLCHHSTKDVKLCVLHRGPKLCLFGTPGLSCTVMDPQMIHRAQTADHHLGFVCPCIFPPPLKELQHWEWQTVIRRVIHIWILRWSLLLMNEV